MAERTRLQRTLDFFTPAKLLIGGCLVLGVMQGITDRTSLTSEKRGFGTPMAEKIEREPKCEGAAAVAKELFTERIAFTEMRSKIDLCRIEHYPELSKFIARNDSVQFRRDNLKCLDEDPDLKNIIDYLKEARDLSHYDAITRLPSAICEVRTDIDLARSRYGNGFVDSVEKLTNRVYLGLERAACTDHSMQLVDILASAVATSNETMLRQFMDDVDSSITEKSRLEIIKCFENDHDLARMFGIFGGIANKDGNLISGVLIKSFARAALEARAGKIEVEQDYGPEFVDAARSIVTRIKIEELHCDKEVKELFSVYLETLRQSKVTPLLTKCVENYNENAGSESFRKRFELCFAEDRDLALMKLEFKRIISLSPNRFYHAMAFAFFAANTKPNDASKVYGPVFVEQARKVMAKLRRRAGMEDGTKTEKEEDSARAAREMKGTREMESEGKSSDWIPGIILALGGLAVVSIPIGIDYYLRTRRRERERLLDAERARDAGREDDAGHDDFDGDDDPGRDRRN